VPEPTASQPVPAPERPVASERVWSGIRALAVHPSREEIHVSFPTLSSDLQIVVVQVNRN
jgi:hypothetical protein